MVPGRGGLVEALEGVLGRFQDPQATQLDLTGRQQRARRTTGGVSQEVWSVFIRRYGGQPAICRYDELDILCAPAPIPASLQERS